MLKNIQKNTFKKREFEKLINDENGDFCAKKIHESLKKYIQNKNCSPTRVLAVGENARGQGLSEVSTLFRKEKTLRYRIRELINSQSTKITNFD